MTFDQSLIAVLVAALVAGLVRGFSGFGAALIFMPVASAAIDPRLAAASFLIFDAVLTLPLLWGAVRTCQWNTVLPVGVSAMATVPFGAAILANADPVTLRWGLSILVLLLLALLASGLRYSGAPSRLASVGVGGVAGVLNGIGQVSGPPVIAFWIAGPFPPPIIRANLIAFFSIASMSSFVAYAWNGFFTMETLTVIAVFAPVYALALFLGARLFGRAPERYYRRIAYAVIALAAITSIPALDELLR
ncbi:sulfite exporter TauE/SafE family protein [Microbaculum marinisediminis]|uniref:Probable membrane transporter protein n=1 Tax=Microbaculum marinisediminis TaxID=2931392 RepID=A0AAW5QZ96_9HYPH|nr:sulfite exporter TauE/SafE family protein [Microbaculum sp. A6E488]MCT8971731.1 sulfite exporter TauE/SafE family protein [Microbaculum sp. A6E488]